MTARLLSIADGLAEWRRDGGALAWEPTEDGGRLWLGDAEEIAGLHAEPTSARASTEAALRQIGMTDAEIAAEMADWATNVPAEAGETRITVTDERYTGGATAAECTFDSLAEAEARLSETFGEPIKLRPGEYVSAAE